MSHVLEILLAAYRAEFPRTRIHGPIKLAVNTGCRKQQMCVLCGEHGPTCSAKWAPTKRYNVWAWEHKCWLAVETDRAQVIADAWLQAHPDDVGPMLGKRNLDRMANGLADGAAA